MERVECRENTQPERDLEDHKNLTASRNISLGIRVKRKLWVRFMEKNFFNLLVHKHLIDIERSISY